MKRVLIVDDHPIIRMTLASELERSGEFELVGQAPDGEEALRLVTHCRPELMVLDLELPKLDGLSVLERLRSQGNRLPILVLSAKDERVMGTRVRAAGENGFVSKLRDVRELLTSMRIVLSGYQCFSQSIYEYRLTDKDLRLRDLSQRELEVLRYVSRGFSNKDIADRLLISDKTVSTYKMRLMKKLEAGSVFELTELSRAHHLID
ncbi:response regulator transcription factor [Pararobbsia alpina]|uniref:Virulence factors putative positive transcription regulator BvgA n=1 Tax=Pararobbsia alpina TaxID=621374 RepID=A0A6S7B5X0_9BURK|nr:response regulator transcription factor [Pararobbsia alpina]CAB3780477.1 Virulence factors putative positive transcription regulator BvgA [Pararobbsia alpina]